MVSGDCMTLDLFLNSQTVRVEQCCHVRVRRNLVKSLLFALGAGVATGGITGNSKQPKHGFRSKTNGNLNPAVSQGTSGIRLQLWWKSEVGKRLGA